jgi:1-deoxy-D-xylulose-5-phosphate reductoisomerase
VSDERLGIALLGATGSVGTSALEVVRHHPDRLRVVALAARGSRLAELAAQAREFAPELVAVEDAVAAERLRPLLPPGVRLVAGEEGLIEAATHPRAQRVVAAMVGAAGLKPAHAALAAGKDLALANKEALVVAGRLLTELAAASGAQLLPVDSEHVALHQALRGGAPREVRRLVLTASGGPFRERPRSTWHEIRPEHALRHPTWSMGAKITIDSATLMNKGLELIEACHLFAIAPERIDVVVHPRSIVHSLVEFRDGSWLAQLAPNDMVFPIQYALSYPERWENQFPALAVETLGSLVFEPLDRERFPAVDLARVAFAMGESGPAVLNAANEIAVHAFLGGQAPFTAIVETVERVLAAHSPGAIGSLEEAMEWDSWGRARARELLGIS